MRLSIVARYLITAPLLVLLSLVASTQTAQAVTNQWSAAEALATARTYHSATLLSSGKVLLAGGSNGSSTLASAELYDPSMNAWSAAGTLATTRRLHTATLLTSGKVLVAGGINVGDLASAELYDPLTNTWSAAGALAAPRRGHTATLLPSGKVLVTGGYVNNNAVASAELYDPSTNTWSTAGALAMGRRFHTATLLPSGKVLVAGGSNQSGILASAELYDPSTNTWSAAGTLATTRRLHTATLLTSGKVMAVGGTGTSTGNVLASVELYDPATNSWSAAGALVTARVGHTATPLPSGRVLVAGGEGASGGLVSAELYDPSTNTWSAAGALATARNAHTATLLPTGEVLVAAGVNSSVNLSSVEIYDPATKTWSAAGSMAIARVAHTATLLPPGKVLVVAGVGNLASAEIYDPATNTWSAAGSLASGRQSHTATLLPSGNVLVAGGRSGSNYLSSAELYDPATNTWSVAGVLSTGRQFHTATLLPSGKVLVAGGSGVSGFLANAELYDPATNTWSAAGALATKRQFHTATLLPAGKVLVAGGYDGISSTLANAELYDPATNTWSAAGALATNRQFHTATLLPSGKVLVAGGRGDSSYPSGAELYDPVTNSWSAAGTLATERQNHTGTLLPSGKVLVAGGDRPATTGLASAELYDPARNSWSAVDPMARGRTAHKATLLPSGKLLVTGGGDGIGIIASAEQLDPGLAPQAELQPNLSAVNAFLLQTSALAGTSAGSSHAIGAITATGFWPALEGSGGNSQNSASNGPVFQIERVDNQQRRFVANDQSVSYTDTVFIGSATALAGFPAGPVLVRVWVNGVPSAARYTALAVQPGQPAAPTATGGNLQATVNFVAVSENGGAPITSYTATATPGGATASCAAPCTNIVFSSIAANTYTFSVHATNAPGNGPESLASNSVTVMNTVATTSNITSADASVVGQNYTVTFLVSAASGTPTGTISVNDGQGQSCGPATLSGGAGSCQIAWPTTGSYTLTATYTPANGSAFFASSGTAIHAVNPAATTTSINSASPNPSQVGSAYSVSFHVNVTAPGFGTPTGNVTVSDGTDSCSASVASGSCALTSSIAGVKSLVATYAGNSNFSGAASPGFAHTVSRHATTTAINAQTPNPSIVNNAVAIAFGVTSSGSTPTGTVTILAGTGESCSATVATGTCSITFATVGSRTLVASYAGAGNFDGSSSMASIQSVVAAPVTDLAVNIGAPVYVQYGKTFTYRIAVSNVGNTAVNGGVVTDTLPPELDQVSASWICLPLGTATCTPTGVGHLNDSSSNIPPGGGVVYLLTTRVPIDGVVPTEQVANSVSVSASGDTNASNDTATWIATVVVFRDGFGQGEDGSQGAQTSLAHPVGSLDDGATLMLDPALASQAPYVSSPWLRATDATGREVLRVDSLRLANDVLVRIISSNVDGGESHSDWMALGAQPVALALADASARRHQLILLGANSANLQLTVPSWATLPLAVFEVQ